MNLHMATNESGEDSAVSGIGHNRTTDNPILTSSIKYTMKKPLLKTAVGHSFLMNSQR